MVFNISIGFANVPTEDGKTKYSVWLADTVLVRPAGEKPVVLTSEIDRKFKSVNYELEEEAVPQPAAGKPNQAALVGVGRKNEVKPKSAAVRGSSGDLNGHWPPPSPDGKKAPAESVVLRDRLRSRNKASSLEENEKLLERQKVLL